MGTKYTTQPLVGYNASPPSDDGAETEANRGYWATIKTKLSDPLKTRQDLIDTALVSYVDLGPITKSGVYTTTAADHLKTIECSGTFILTLGAAAMMTAGYTVTIKNTGTGTITVDGNGAETIDGQASVDLTPEEAITVQVDSTATEYIILGYKDPRFHTPVVTGGVADAYTATTGETAYITNRVYQVQIHASNTGASTINFDSLGVKNIKDLAGTDPDANALRIGQVVHLVYDGTNMVITSAGLPLPSNAITQVMMADAAIGQAELKTTTASQTVSVVATSSASIIPTGGTYTLQSFDGAITVAAGRDLIAIAHGNSYAAERAMKNEHASVNYDWYLYSRYVQASPPWNMGNGDIALFITLKMNKVTGQILAMDVAPDPHCAYHGPHNLHPHDGKIQKAAGAWGKNLKAVLAGTDTSMTKAEALSLLRGIKEIKNDPKQLKAALKQEFTMEEKMADMAAYPYSFSPPGQDEVCVIVDPCGSITDDLAIIHEHMGEDSFSGGSVNSFFESGAIVLGDQISANAPPGMIAVSAKWKNTV